MNATFRIGVVVPQTRHSRDAVHPEMNHRQASREHPIRCAVWGGAILFLVLCCLGSVSEASAQGTLPPLHGTTLNGEAVDLSAVLKGHIGILVVGFSQASRSDVTAWGKRLALDLRDSSNPRYYELPVLASVPRLLRGFVLKRLATDIPEPARPHFLPIYDHEPEWRSLAAYSKPDDAYILLVDSNGIVRWHTQGYPAEATYNALKQHVESLRNPQ